MAVSTTSGSAASACAAAPVPRPPHPINPTFSVFALPRPTRLAITPAIGNVLPSTTAPVDFKNILLFAFPDKSVLPFIALKLRWNCHVVSPNVCIPVGNPRLLHQFLRNTCVSHPSEVTRVWLAATLREKREVSSYLLCCQLLIRRS